MAGSYNTSVAASRSARLKASTRTPVYFYLQGPYYIYLLPCGAGHEFRSRTLHCPVTDDGYIFWCAKCEAYVFTEIIEPHCPLSTDELMAMEQDRGIKYERVARELQRRGFLSTDEEILAAAEEFRLTHQEIRRINLALSAPENLSGLPDMCRARIHEMTPENTLATRRGSDGKRRCRACLLIAQREYAARKRKARL